MGNSDSRESTSKSNASPDIYPVNLVVLEGTNTETGLQNVHATVQFNNGYWLNCLSNGAGKPPRISVDQSYEVPYTMSNVQEHKFPANAMTRTKNLKRCLESQRTKTMVVLNPETCKRHGTFVADPSRETNCFALAEHVLQVYGDHSAMEAAKAEIMLYL